MPEVSSDEIECDRCYDLFVPVDDWNTTCHDCACEDWADEE